MVLFVVLSSIPASSRAATIVDVLVTADGRELGNDSRITNPQGWLPPGTTVAFEVTIRGKQEMGFLGVTIQDEDGNELDLDVEPFELESGFLGSRDETRVVVYGTLGPPLGVLDDDYPLRLRYVVCLWRDRVLAYRCHNGPDGTPCVYCRRNGYHMEGRIACTGWRHLGVLGDFVAATRH
jgi:hypothetical protein